ncbi:acetate--CoA ligase [Candidatus Woesearchaeota archaeon]|nr:acetate--CoA ligase [Candidatus Woesearchaeota archaeon]MBT6520162.1 acetate--CoA ligase [Candidatus Woesearchaeota archaeon]MBT7366767.1 acetate--CoA ligase [Candidatus Woesearchaeota archaeon]
MDQSKLINKTKEQLKIEPNLINYEATAKDFDYKVMEQEIEFVDGKLNAAYNAVDRHLKTDRKDKPALIWCGDDNQEKIFTFEQLSKFSNKIANALVKLGAQKGDRVFIFLPRIPELYASFLGIVKTGAIAATLFAAFGPEALSDRLADSGTKFVITTSQLKSRVEEIFDDLKDLQKVLVVSDSEDCELTDYEIDFNKLIADESEEFDTVMMDPKDSCFMLYTSGTTGKPKGVVHHHYAILHEHLTAKWVLDVHDSDVYWCTADPGWVTGIAYGILGIWSAGATSIVHEGRFSAKEWYGIIDKHKVSIWYTAPTAIRMLMKEGVDELKSFDFSSLRYLCSVGEPLNPEAIKWSLDNLGLPFHDNYWQTETGGIVIANYPNMPIKPGSMGKPFPGIHAAIVDEDFNELPPGEEGNLVMKPGWPSMMKEVWNNPEKFNEYFKKGWYITGDRVKVDEDGYFWFVGRADDVINTAGHRVGPFEVESALIEHPAVCEAGVIGKPDKLFGEIIKAFIVLNKGYTLNDELMVDIKKFIKKHLSGHAYPKEIEVRDSLPKTRSGKIVRRLLKAQELGEDTGDTSTLDKD